MSAEEIIQQLSAANRKLDQARAKAGSAVQDVNEARVLAGAALHGSSTGLLALIDQVREGLSQAAGRIEPAKQRVSETIARAKALGE